MPSASPPRFRLRNHKLLKLLMQHTGSGSRITIRELAVAAGCAASFIGKLVLGEQETATFEVAHAIADRIGVDLLVLWEPVERAARAQDRLRITEAAS